MRLVDYVANYIVENGITDGFSVVGGGAVHLNDAFGHKDGLHMLYNHHEQACSMAAESYARLNSKPALVCVTTGPGGVNAMNGVMCAYLDSLPMVVISGQVRYDTTTTYEYETTGARLRSEGDQEYNIIESVKPVTKYAVMIKDKNTIRYHLERAVYLATTGRKGPTWIDIPVDIQNSDIDIDTQKSYFDSDEYKNDKTYLCDEIDDDTIRYVLSEINKAKKPVLYAGYGIRLAGAYDSFKRMIKKLSIPIVTYWNAIDLMETSDELYCGRGGNMGDRVGNFAVQNSDLLLVIGSRVSIRQTGYAYKDWARNAKVIMVDIDKDEMNKHTLHIDKKINVDAKVFIDKMNILLDSSEKYTSHNDWIIQCQKWKEKYKVVTDKNYNQKDKVNVYAFMDYLSNRLKDNTITCLSNGACCVVGNQCFNIKNGTRVHNNNATASMGYGLPASIGACISNNKKEVYCIEGDGSIMMNLQELQTIKTNDLPIKIFIINNEGYHSIRITQNNLYPDRKKVGIGKESNDLSFPDYSKIAFAFSYEYLCAKNNQEMKDIVDKVIDMKGNMIIEIFTDTTQVWEPKTATKKLDDGTMFSSALDDMAPFLSKNEKENILR